MMNQYREIKEKIEEADAIVIGASNGFSIAEGLNIFDTGKDFQNLFRDFKNKYGMRNILEGYFTRYETIEEYWGFMSRLALHYSGQYHGSAITDVLHQLVDRKPYFFITSNGEHHFALAGFDKDYIYELEGSFQYMQCIQPCHRVLYPAMDRLIEMGRNEKNGVIPANMIPRCPRCGKPMILNVMTSPAFIPHEKQRMRYIEFMQQYQDKKIVILELGIGWRNQMIKKPFMDFVKKAPQATYIVINKGEVYIPEEIMKKSFGLDGDIRIILKDLIKDE